MTLDLRDERLWMKHAKRRQLERRLDLYRASLLPNFKSDAMKQEMDSLVWEINSLDHGEEIEAIERQAKARREEMRKPKLPVKRTYRPKPRKRKRRT